MTIRRENLKSPNKILNVQENIIEHISINPDQEKDDHAVKSSELLSAFEIEEF